MAYICLDCGHIFEDGEERVIIERHPYGSTTAEEKFSVCPVCGGDFEEAQTCACCGGHFLDDDLVAGYYCKECVEDFMTAENMKKFIAPELYDFALFMYDEENKKSKGGD